MLLSVWDVDYTEHWMKVEKIEALVAVFNGMNHLWELVCHRFTLKARLPSAHHQHFKMESNSY